MSKTLPLRDRLDRLVEEMQADLYDQSTDRLYERKMQRPPLVTHRRPTLALRLLIWLFGPRVTPTPRGLSVARLALAVGALLLVAFVAVAMGAVADFLIDPTPLG